MNVIKIEEIGYQKIIACLRQGGVIVYPTDTAYGLGCDATNEKACEKIFAIKGRDKGKTLSLIASDKEMVEDWLEFSDKAQELAKNYWHGALGLVLPVKKEGLAPQVVQDGCAAVRVPDNIIARALSRELGAPIVATSANESGQGPCYSMDDVVKSLSTRADKVAYGIDFGVLKEGEISTIAKVTASGVEVIRPGVIQLEN